jgi:hypothetical protein
MNKRMSLFFLLMSALGVGCAQIAPAPPVVIASVAPVKLTPGTTVPAETISIPVVVLEGEPTQIGTEHGQRFHDQIQDLYNHYLLPHLPGSVLIRARLAAASFELYMLPDHRAETQALATATGLSVYDAMLAQCILDLMPVEGCSTITLPASASPDGVARFGRNLDFDSLGLLQKDSVLLVYKPKGKYQFAAIGWPGMVGVVSGMNERGLCVANMEVERGFRPPSAMPYTLLYRAILEQCRTVDEAIAFLQRTPKQTANNLMLMDAAGDRAVAEIRPEGVTIRRGEGHSALISTNHQRGQDTGTPGYCWRYDSLHSQAAADFGKLSLPNLEKMLGSVVQGDRGEMTLQSMIFEPASQVIYLATGLDAPAHRFERIDLKRYFGPEPAIHP